MPEMPGNRRSCLMQDWYVANNAYSRTTVRALAELDGSAYFRGFSMRDGWLMIAACAGLATLVPVLTRMRSGLAGTALVHAWPATLLTWTVWTVVSIVTLAPSPLRPWADCLWYLAAVAALIPPIAALGARRPINRSWTWFVLVPLVLVFAWPVMPTVWRGADNPAAFDLEDSSRCRVSAGFDHGGRELPGIGAYTLGLALDRRAVPGRAASVSGHRELDHRRLAGPCLGHDLPCGGRLDCRPAGCPPSPRLGRRAIASRSSLGRFSRAVRNRVGALPGSWIDSTTRPAPAGDRRVTWAYMAWRAPREAGQRGQPSQRPNRRSAGCSRNSSTRIGSIDESGKLRR